MSDRKQLSVGSRTAMPPMCLVRFLLRVFCDSCSGYDGMRSGCQHSMH
jgi:hypothetical protein